MELRENTKKRTKSYLLERNRENVERGCIHTAFDEDTAVFEAVMAGLSMVKTPFISDLYDLTRAYGQHGATGLDFTN